MKHAATIARLGDQPGKRFFSCDGCGTLSDIPVPQSPPKK
jgi:hypothetical protein